jgi:hypothetical protein
VLDLSGVSDLEIIDRLDKAVIAERLAESDEWQIVKEACDRIVRKAQQELHDVDVFQNPNRAVELQILIKVLGNLLPGVVHALKSEGELAFFEARERRLEEVSET